MPQSKKVGFTVHGDFITNHFRSLVREGNWRKAIEDVMDSLHGMTREYAEMILAGKAKMEGVNTVELLEDDIHTDAEWLKAHYSPYTANLFIYNDEIYKVYKNVEYLDSDDADKASALFGWDALPAGDKTLLAQYTYDRVRTYMRDMHNDIALYTDESGWILCEKATPDYPSWLRRSEFIDIIKQQRDGTWDEKARRARTEIVDDSAVMLLNRQHIMARNSGSADMVATFLENMEKSDQAMDNLEELKDRIRAQTEEKGGWLTLRDKRNSATYKIPKNAFLRWCLSDSPVYQSIDWSALSPRGMKMGMDDPNHTDWWLFTGLPLDEANNHNSKENTFFFNERHRLHEEMTGSNLKCLVNSEHEGLKDMPVVCFDSPGIEHDIPYNSTIVIPNASPDYEMLARKATKQNCVIITETGGALCHLATIGREMGLQLYLLPDARQKLHGVSIASLDTKKHHLTINDYSGHEFEAVLRNKRSGEHYK